VERRIERSVLYLENIFRSMLDNVRDGMAMRRAEHQRLKDQHVQRALQQFTL